MITKSLHKTNVRIASNIKLVVNSKNEMFLEMIPSSEYLSLSMFKGYEYNESLEWGTNLRNFASTLSNIDELYSVYDETVLNINDNLSTQYQQLYNWGCYSDPSKFVDENLRFFAPLHISKDDEMPDMFVVLKVSGKEYDELLLDSSLSTWIKQGTIVHTQDLTNIKKRIFNSLDESFINLQFNQQDTYNDVLQLHGLNITSGLSNHVEDTTISDFLNNEVSITEFENWITNSYKRNQLIYNNIINLEFAFTDEPTNSFERYVGFYVKRNTTELTIAQEYIDSGVLSLIEHHDRIEKVEETSIIETYDEIGFSQFANSFGVKKAPIFEFNFAINPPSGSLIQIMYIDAVEHNIIVDSSILSNDINITKQNIVDSINLSYKGVSSTIKASILTSGWIRLESNSSSSQFENLRVSVPLFFSVKKPVYTESTYNNSFIGSTNKTISLNSYINVDAYNKLMYYDNDGNKIISSITRVYQYKGDWFYELADSIVNKNINPSNIWFVKETSSKVSVCSLFPHAEIDFDKENSTYSDILDFDIDKYKGYLKTIVEGNAFIGDVLAYYNETDINAITEIQLNDYKDVLSSKIDSFFDSISLNREYLFKDIDLLTSEASTITNPYLRLEETSNLEFSKKDRLFQFINKWSHTRGSDVYMNPYRLNIGLPFRNDSFAPSQSIVDRNISYHTHSWFILADGQNPYYEINEETINKHLSYSRVPLTESMLLDTSIDAYSALTYETNINEYNAWSTFYYDEEQEACYCFFRGVLYRFETNDLTGYRFSVMMKGSESVIDDVYKMKLLRNDEFKTLTLFINFYVPDPILTSLERGNSNYYLDRSLLYFSNEIYSTTNSSIDFGTDRISLSLYDSTSQKLYLNQPVTTNWFHNSSLGPILWVGRGSSSIFNVSLNDIISVGDDFEIYYTSSDDDTSPFYGMYITFEEIVEVTATHFWCKRIIVKSTITSDPEVVHDLDISDNVVDEVQIFNVYNEWVANNNVFNVNNTIYISRAIAYENCIYTKVVSASVNNARYKEISLANIKNFMFANPLQVNDDSHLKAMILEPAEAEIIIRLFSKNKKIQLLPNSYFFPIRRYNGTYKPQLHVLSNAKDSDEFKRIYASKLLSTFEYKLNISKNVKNEENRISRWESTSLHTHSNNFYSYISANTGNTIVERTLPWCSNAKEHRSYASIVFNSQERISIQSEYNDTIVIWSLLRENSLQWLSKVINTMTAEQQLNLSKLYLDTVEETLQNYDYRDIAIRNFVQNTFLSIYHIETIKDANGNIVQFNINNGIITIVESFNTTALTITFRR